jgi:hypothetical protein
MRSKRGVREHTAADPLHLLLQVICRYENLQPGRRRRGRTMQPISQCIMRMLTVLTARRMAAILLLPLKTKDPVLFR